MGKHDTTIRVKISSKDWVEKWSKDLMLPAKINFLEELRKSDRINRLLEEESRKRVNEFLKDRRIK